MNMMKFLHFKLFSIGSKYDLSDPNNLPVLSITLLHKGTFDFSESSLGKVEVDLSTITCNTKDDWYRIIPDGRTTDVTGELRLRLSFNIEPEIDELDIDEESGLLPKSDVEKEFETIDATVLETNEIPTPNRLDITLFSAKNLPKMDTDIIGRATSSDPIVRFKISGLNHQDSTVQKKSINPVWNELFTFSPVLDSSLSLEVKIEDYNTLQTRKFIGKIVLPLNAFSDMTKIRKTYKLMSESGSTDTVERGEIELGIQWKFDAILANDLRLAKQKRDSSLFGKITKLGNKIVGNEEDDETDEIDIADAVVEETRPQTEEEKKVKEEEEKTRKKELSDIEIKSGDYQVLVHIIEARDLKAENYNGSSDPVVYIEALGQKQNTKVIQNAVNCVFDDLHIFNYRDLDKETFNEGFIRVIVYDSGLIKKTMIGAFVIDASQVYNVNKDHEFYRQWVPLMDDEDAADTGVQGYLKITIQIVGPGEKVKVHDEAAEMAKDLEREAKSGNDVSNLIASVPVMRKEWLFLVVSIYRYVLFYCIKLLY